MQSIKTFINQKISEKDLNQNFNDQSRWIIRNSWYTEKSLETFKEKFVTAMMAGFIDKFVQINEYKKVKGLVNSYISELYNDKLTYLFNEYVRKNNLPPVFTRRIDLHKFEKIMRGKVRYFISLSQSLNEFKTKIIYGTLLEYMDDKYNIDFSEIPDEDTHNFIIYLIDTFEGLLEYQYKHLKKK